MIKTEDVEKLAKLSRINVCDEEKKIFSKEIEIILNYVDQIKLANEVSNDKRLFGEGELKNVFREDGDFHKPGQFTEDLLKNATEKENGYIKVKKIL